MYTRLNDYTIRHMSAFVETVELTVLKAKALKWRLWWRMRYRHQETMIAFAVWRQSMHFYRVPGTRYTQPITVVLSPSTGVGVGVPGRLVGYRWRACYTRSKGKSLPKWESGFFADDTTVKTQVW